MDVIKVINLKIGDIKVLSYGRYSDDRGYFSESIRLSDIQAKFLKNFNFKQINESFSKKGVIRGLHFQWNPYMGKLVRTIKGTMYDIALDIRLDSSSFGKAVIYKMESNVDKETNDWIWVPPGFAHGNFFTEDTYIEYICTGEYAPKTEAGISPFANDIDWSLVSREYKNKFDEISSATDLISEKDKGGFSLKEWKNRPDSQNFTLKKLSG